ncbi:MAG: response regulator [Balneolaceae bacterium]|nr:response regulator [Balneolaceae bacterium]
MTAHKILVVDDDDLILESIFDVLDDAGYVVHTAENGAEALNKIYDQKHGYDLIISDIAMPNITGFDLLKKVNFHPETYHIPFIILSANNNKEFVKQGFKSGAVEFLDKPFNNSGLLKSIKEVLYTRQKMNNTIFLRIKALKRLRETIKKLSHLNSHELRHSNSKLMQITEMVKNDQIESKQALHLINRMGVEIEQFSNKIQNIMDDRLEVLTEKLSLLNIDNDSTLWFVDDDELTNVLHTKLTELYLNVKFKTFSDADEALEQLDLSNKHPDVIFLDLNMPGISGFDFLEIMKERKYNIPTVILSSSIQKSDIDRFLTYQNVVTYLTKPLKKKTLLLLSNES